MDSSGTCAFIAAVSVKNQQLAIAFRGTNSLCQLINQLLHFLVTPEPTNCNFTATTPDSQQKNGGNDCNSSENVDFDVDWIEPPDGKQESVWILNGLWQKKWSDWSDDLIINRNASKDSRAQIVNKQKAIGTLVYLNWQIGRFLTDFVFNADYHNAFMQIQFWLTKNRGERF